MTVATNVLSSGEVAALLRCPRCSSKVVAEEGAARVRCSSADCALSTGDFPMVDGQPVLIDFAQSIFEERHFREGAGSSVIGPRDFNLGRKDTLLKKLGWDTNPSAKRICEDLRERVRSSAGARRPLVLVVGGGQSKYAVKNLYTDPEIDVVGTDVYSSPLTTLLVDGHRLPFANGSFDAVWIQAVLEHVLDPQRVVDEIHRVLRPEGLVFADTPFMQVVHEKAWDFTRFTLSGHRWLFRHFKLIEAGCSNGAAIMLLWAARYFVRAMFGHTAGKIAARLLFWLPLLDRFGQDRYIADAASGVYFYGIRTETEITPAEIVAFYDRQVRLPVRA